MNSSTRDTEYDAGNRRHVERAEKAARSARRQLDEAVRWLMGDLRGRRLVWSLLGQAGEVDALTIRGEAQHRAYAIRLQAMEAENRAGLAGAEGALHSQAARSTLDNLPFKVVSSLLSAASGTARTFL